MFIEPGQIWRIDCHYPKVNYDDYSFNRTEAVYVFSDSRYFLGHFCGIDREQDSKLKLSNNFIVMKSHKDNWYVYLTSLHIIIECCILHMKECKIENW